MIARRQPKPIRVFYSSLSQRFYATRAWREVKPGVIECTGQRFDVTDDIGELIIRHQITFTAPKSDDDDSNGGSY